MVFQKIRYRQENKQVRIALQKIFGIGPSLSNHLCDLVGISTQKVKDLSNAQIEKLSSTVTNQFFFGADLKRLIKTDINRLSSIGCFRGSLHKKNTKLLEKKRR
jgi:small subunit ribosomal protein S13|uniref:Ribosomal protein S13 n=1 Tax=Scherffelia dubia TaxID=3190 RepID=A0A650ARS5_SCHDU|nr:ribosomal protein S13 [Scherffelia dubia]QGP70670.1 ribosomal protein S13 [Scherffelia dubia]